MQLKYNVNETVLLIMRQQENLLMITRRKGRSTVLQTVSRYVVKITEMLSAIRGI